MIHRLPFPVLLPTATVAGALNVLSFAPFGWWPLQILLFALLFWRLHRDASVKQSIWLGLAYGWGWSVCGVWWLYVSMHDYGGMPGWLAALAVALMGLVLGTFAALAAGAGAWLRQRWSAAATTTLLLVLPACWALGEWLRGWVLTGLPWVASGYAHNASPLSGWAPVLGVYGLGWLAALLGGALALLASKTSRALPLALIALAIGGGWSLRYAEWTQPAGAPISVRLLQGNVPQNLKFDPDRLIDTLAGYDVMIREMPADLIATPETALPLLSYQIPAEYIERLSAFSRRTGSHIVIGLPFSERPKEYANSVIGLAPNMALATSANRAGYRYDKHHLVPFGEFVPFGFRWFVDMMRIPLGDFGRGAAVQAPFAVKDQQVLPNICYEDLFGEEIAAQIAATWFSETPQPTMLLNVSNIAWFGDTIALPQHLQISQMRALETRRPMLRATNTGATAVISHDGKLAAQLPPFQKDVLSTNVQGYSGITPYILLGNRLIVLLAFLALVLAWLLGRKKPADAHFEGKTR